MGKFAVKIERVITIALILSMMLILIPGVSVQAKAKKCNHKSVTWITTSKPSCTDEGMKVKKCKNCGKILKIKKIKKSGHRLRTQIEKMPTCTKPGLTATYCLNPDCIYGIGAGISLFDGKNIVTSMVDGFWDALNSLFTMILVTAAVKGSNAFLSKAMGL